jgi:hypothetical protein
LLVRSTTVLRCSVARRGTRACNTGLSCLHNDAPPSQRLGILRSGGGGRQACRCIVNLSRRGPSAERRTLPCAHWKPGFVAQLHNFTTSRRVPSRSDTAYCTYGDNCGRRAHSKFGGSVAFLDGGGVCDKISCTMPRGDDLAASGSLASCDQVDTARSSASRCTPSPRSPPPAGHH